MSNFFNNLYSVGDEVMYLGVKMKVRSTQGFMPGHGSYSLLTCAYIDNNGVIREIEFTPQEAKLLTRIGD